MFRIRMAMRVITCFNFAIWFFIIISMSSGEPLTSQQKPPLKDTPDNQTPVHHSQQIGKLIDLIMNTSKRVHSHQDKQRSTGVPSGNVNKVGAEIVDLSEEAQDNPWTQPTKVTTGNSSISRAETGPIEMGLVSRGGSRTESIIIDLLREYCYRLFISGVADIPTYCYQVLQGQRAAAV